VYRALYAMGRAGNVGNREAGGAGPAFGSVHRAPGRARGVGFGIDHTRRAGHGLRISSDGAGNAEAGAEYMNRI
jgi:hypothetical protein